MAGGDLEIQGNKGKIPTVSGMICSRDKKS
jgi:hypothetical protein